MRERINLIVPVKFIPVVLIKAIVPLDTVCITREPTDGPRVQPIDVDLKCTRALLPRETVATGPQWL